jgi:hypothetical protein
VGRRVHAVLYQTSPGVLENTWPLVCDCPTAVQESAEVHETPLPASQKLAVTHDTEVNGENPGTVAPADQAVPFQVFTWPKPLTDTQKSTVTQDTARGRGMHGYRWESTCLNQS